MNDHTGSTSTRGRHKTTGGPHPQGRLALYCRVSTDGQTVDNQIHELVAYAERRDLPYEVFADQGVSGRRDRRPELDRMVAAVQRREYSAVVVWKLDRLARSLSHMARLGEELQALGCELISITETIDTSTPTGRALFGICGVFAQLEADLIRERTRLGLERARREGKRIGRPTVVDAGLRERITRLRKHGHSLRQIAAVLGLSKGVVQRVVETISA